MVLVVNLSNHSEQVEFVIERDGLEKGIAYARQCLLQYRRAAQPQPNDNKKQHFAHSALYRKHYVESIIYLRNFLRDK